MAEDIEIRVVSSKPCDLIPSADDQLRLVSFVLNGDGKICVLKNPPKVLFIYD